MPKSTERLHGVDAARGLALLGMMATHLVALSDGWGNPSWAALFSGRASALFAVLAGVGLALSTGREAAPSGRGLAAARAGVLTRAAIIVAIGLTLGLVPTTAAVILVHYGLLFGLATLFLGMRKRVLAIWLVLWTGLSPVLAQLLRGNAPELQQANPTWADVVDLPTLLSTLFLTGYYPVLQWLAYLIAGLLIGRLALDRIGIQCALLACSATVAVLAKLASAALITPAVHTRLLAADQPSGGLDLALDTGFYGSTPTDTWWWLAVAGPHSGTPLDLAHTIGTAGTVLAICLLLCKALGRHQAAISPLTGAGSMTLTLYSAHVVMLGFIVPVSATTLYLIHALVALAIGGLFAATGSRGPLELLAHAGSSAARKVVAAGSR
ncbi:heparan-alpha-glucosaminide N-acetyltransferase domain-containing protein [Saxibacter everestensis]|uniref:Heparan-alpha-glucosaminide N-acetyltransferase domain-containing protein n=1 Tax=Saxibacter everestensis TaxID=2909229 RepID=A0ABY8QXF8_9MICO|nr:heparan-alpha-glucosaminide N-acetyltransferase domain-containing protein [Brevibacteriaceae bacterium ZFBP1038]